MQKCRANLDESFKTQEKELNSKRRKNAELTVINLLTLKRKR